MKRMIMKQGHVEVTPKGVQIAYTAGLVYNIEDELADRLMSTDPPIAVLEGGYVEKVEPKAEEPPEPLTEKIELIEQDSELQPAPVAEDEEI